MATSETTFADRLGRGQTMLSAISQFDPPFAPADAAIAAEGFGTFMTDLATLNGETSGSVDQFSTQVETRTAQVAEVKEVALRVRSFVESNKAWKKHLRPLQSVVNKIRGNRPKKPKAPPADETAEQKKARNSGEQSYAEIHANFRRMIAILEKIAGYAPPAAELTLAGLNTLADSLGTLNTDMSDLADQIIVKQRERLAAYDGEDGLKEKMIAIKKAARGQYGGKSPEFLRVKGIRV